MNLPDQLIGYRVFTDKANRSIFQQADGRQYVLVDEEGAKGYGVWQLPEGRKRGAEKGEKGVRLGFPRRLLLLARATWRPQR
jgi:hypothetical protein